jgi:hypothetical protein
MQSIKDMLEAEMKASQQFTNENFGLKVGDSFPEMVREVVKYDHFAMQLIMQLAIGGIMGLDVVKDISMMGEDRHKQPWGPIILQHLFVFEMPLSLLYWGMQIGRKLERDEQRAVAGLDNAHQQQNEKDQKD